ncbi:MFS transporter [Cellulophaga baltica]|uniref:MFS transporter n=1 Tax=Cellulophaga TaxID=104264 RepID=UPI001C06A0D2|nr:MULTISPECIES: MFS transporter [Cellulophaga]MBU2996633.1 MFS transporter [Cellulophaga baltica]MDO6768027.1 MFS transporter [Cellulophaga sp. 1_MG-2023]
MGNKENKTISRSLLVIMATAIAATAANLYYNQPLIPEIGKTMGLDEHILGFIPSASQIGYATAIFFISPLGDIMNRKLVIRNLSIALVTALLGVYFAPNFAVLIVATFVVGLSSNITQQLIPLGVSLTSPENKGRVVATLMTGLTIGILLSRTLSGFIAEHLGWRAVFLGAAIIAAIIGIVLQIVLPSNKPIVTLSYSKLLKSMLTLIKTKSLLQESALVGALWFAAFNALWATIAIHLMDDPFGYSVQQVGLLGFVGASGIFGAKIAGKWADKVGSRSVMTVSLSVILLSFVVMALGKDSIAMLCIGIVLLDLGVFGSQVPNQVRVFSVDVNAQSRANAVYMLFYYLGAAVGSAIGVKVMSQFGWFGLTAFGFTLIAIALTFHLYKTRKLKLKAI